MTKNGDQVSLNETEASGGRKVGAMRWVLGISLTLAIIAMSAVWIIPALMG